MNTWRDWGKARYNVWNMCFYLSVQKMVYTPNLRHVNAEYYSKTKHWDEASLVEPFCQNHWDLWIFIHWRFLGKSWSIPRPRTFFCLFYPIEITSMSCWITKHQTKRLFWRHQKKTGTTGPPSPLLSLGPVKPTSLQLMQWAWYGCAHESSVVWFKHWKLWSEHLQKKTINTYKHQQWWFGFLFWCMEQIYEPLTKQTDYIGFSLSKKNILNGLETFSRNSLRYLGKNIDQTDTNITFVRTEQFAPVKPPITTMLSWYSASSSCLPTAQRCNGNWSLTERGPAKRRSRWESKSY